MTIDTGVFFRDLNQLREIGRFRIGVHRPIRRAPSTAHFPA